MPECLSFSLGVSRVMSSPLILMEPLKMLVNPKMEWRIVDLPAPLGPIRQRDWFLATWRLKSWSISILPYPARRLSMET